MCQKTKQRFGFIHRYQTDGTKIDSNMNHKVLSVARRRTCFKIRVPKRQEDRKKPRPKSGNPVKIQVDGLNPNNFSIAK